MKSTVRSRKWLFAFLFVVSMNAFGVAEDKNRYLIIHADDAGMSHSANLATQAALECGIVSSASVMVPCPWFTEFARYAKAHPQYDYGIHLTLNSEWDVYRWGPVESRDRVPSLVDPEGFLWDNTEQVAAHTKAAEVKLELKAQIDKALAFGVPLSHLDTHMGALVSRPDLVSVYVELGLEYGLPILFLKQMDPAMKKEYPAMAERHDEAVSRLTDRKLPLLDNLLQFYGGNIPDRREQLYFDEIRKIGPGVTQLIVHCGYDNEELRAISDSSKRRDQDRQIFTDPKMKKFIDEQGIQVISWKQFRELAFPIP
jgi:predicted glycoside hydrolase/deacetylase ChbG (UPF0249 family)